MIFVASIVDIASACAIKIHPELFLFGTSRPNAYVTHFRFLLAF